MKNVIKLQKENFTKSEVNSLIIDKNEISKSVNFVADNKNMINVFKTLSEK